MSSVNEHLYDVFLSHNSCDKEAVERLAERLRGPACGPSSICGIYCPTLLGKRPSK
jgi:hypothetical protein